jgi:two-component system sensor kinase FixL
LKTTGNNRSRRSADPGDGPPQNLEAHWAALVDATFNAILVFGQDGRIQSCNRAGEQIFGCPAEELVGQNVRTLLPLEQLPIPENADWYDDSPQCKPMGHHDLMARRVDGRAFPVRVAVGEFAVGSDRGYVGIVHDITLLRDTEATLRQRENLLDLTIQNAPTGIATVDLQGRFLTVNQSLCSMVGYSEAELLDRPVDSITHPDDVESAGRRLHELRSGTASEYQTRKRYIRKDGSVVDGLLSACLVHDSQGQPLMYVSQVEDLTDRLRAEAEARESRDKLAHVTRLNLLGEMAAGIAHEINQPLTAIAAYAHASRRMIRTGATPVDELAGILEKIALQAERAGDVIRRLREFVRQRSSPRQLVKVEELIDGIVGLAEVDARIHDLTIQVDVDQQIQPVFADPVQIQQVVLNLLRNAIESMDDPGIFPRIITVHGAAREDDYVEISVKDQGGGISPDAERQLFKTFFSTKPAGLGMGLAISRRIVESHGGRLWFTKNPDRGTTFRLSLPAAVGDADAES